MNAFWTPERRAALKAHWTPARRLAQAEVSRKRWEGHLAEGEHTHPLVRQLFRIMNKNKTLMREVAERAGIRTSTLSDWRYTKSPTLVTFCAAVNALGYEVVLRPIRDDE